MVKWLAIIVVSLGTPAKAKNPQQFWSNEDDVYFCVIDENEAILTSRFPKSWYHGESSDDLQVHTKPAIIYFGKDCLAMHNEYGKGTWSGANGAFGATFGDHTIYFDRQELYGTQFERCYYPGY